MKTETTQKSRFSRNVFKFSNIFLIFLGGSLWHHTPSLKKILQLAYPDHEWLPWRFNRAPDGFWQSPSNVRSYIDWLCQKLSPQQTPAEVLTQLTPTDLLNNHGAGLLEHYNGSFIAVIRMAYPDTKIPVWKYRRTPLDFWRDSPAAQREFFDSAFQELRLRSLEDWYSVTKSRLVKCQGAFPLDRLYGGSLTAALKAVYPQHPWAFWRFKKASSGHWKDKTNQREFLDHVRKQMGLKTVEQLYTITREDIISHGGGSLLLIYGGVYKTLNEVYPEHKLEAFRFQRSNAPFTTQASSSSKKEPQQQQGQ